LLRKADKEAIVLTDFYISFSAICFTLLGLWIIVVQTRHAEWRGSSLHRRRAYGVAMHFSLPGLMSLLALVNPNSSSLWRVSFAVAAIGGAAVLIALHGPAPGKFGLAAYILAIALYALIGVLAIAPHIVTGTGLDTAPVRAEAVLLTILVFAGVNVGWLLLFEEAPDPSVAGGAPGRDRQAFSTRETDLPRLTHSATRPTAEAADRSHVHPWPGAYREELSAPRSPAVPG
jgi:hypothetical protein